MTNAACQLEHSIDVEVSKEFAWNWRTDISNWDDPPAEFQLGFGANLADGMKRIADAMVRADGQRLPRSGD